MNRLVVEVVALILVLGGSVWLLIRQRGSIGIQLAAALIVGVTASAVVLADRFDLVPDQWEDVLIVGVAVLALLAIVALGVFRPDRCGRRQP